MFPKPNKNNINNWRRAVVGLLFGIEAIACYVLDKIDLSEKTSWWIFVGAEFIACSVLVWALFFLRENFRSAYAVLEISLAGVVILLVLTAGLNYLGMPIKAPLFTTLIGSAASAFYFGVRALDNLVQSEIKKRSKLGRWFNLWVKNHPAPVIYPWNVARPIEPVACHVIGHAVEIETMKLEADSRERIPANNPAEKSRHLST